MESLSEAHSKQSWWLHSRPLTFAQLCDLKCPPADEKPVQKGFQDC